MTPEEGAYYHEDQIWLGNVRGGLGNTCASHALNAAIGGPVSNYEHHGAVTTDEFDQIVASHHLPALEWRYFGAGSPVPAQIEATIGPRRAVVQLAQLDPDTG
ncbi:hypothetical protein, partial [Rhizobium johnstonii]